MIFHAFNPSSRCQKSQVTEAKQKPQPHLLHGIDVLAWFQSPRALIDSCMLNGREVNFVFFLVFFDFLFVFWVSHVFSFFFWYFPVILLDFPVNSDVFFTFVLFLLAVPCVSYFFVFVPFILLHSLSLPMKHGCCCICSCCMSCFVLPFFPCSYVFCFFVLFLEEVWR